MVDTAPPALDINPTLTPDEAARLRDGVAADGYAIAKGLLPAALVQSLKAFWLEELSKPRPNTPLVWGPYLGEPNRIIFDDTSTHCMVRALDMLWNQPIHAPTREMCLKLSRLRNQVAEAELHYGELMTPDRYGSYVSATLYPPGKGFLVDHEDGVDERRHWHFLVPLTFRGPDFKGGGLHMTDRHGSHIDVEEHVQAGDVLFFDANLRHGVTTIEPYPDRPVGRLQTFAIPTILELPHRNTRSIDAVGTVPFLRSRARRIRDALFGRPLTRPGKVDFYTYKK